MTGPDYANLERHVPEETPRARGHIEDFSEGYSARECRRDRAVFAAAAFVAFVVLVIAWLVMR